MTRNLLSRVALVTGALLICLGAGYRAIALSLLDSRTFGERAAESLTDPDVATYAADRVTDALLAQKPDLIAVRPFISATADGLVSSRAFRAMVGAAATEAHAAALSEGARRVVVALPDVQVLFKSVLQSVSPEVAKKIPDKLTTVIADLGNSRAAMAVVDAARLGQRLRTVAGALLLVGLLLLVLAIWLADDRRRALIRSGTALAVTGLVLLLIMPLGRLALTGAIDDEVTRRAAQGVLLRYLWPLRLSGRVLLAAGVLVAAGGRSLFEAVDPVTQALDLVRRLATPPTSVGGRLGWGLLLLSLGVLMVIRPAEVLSAAIVLGGAAAAYVGVRELFRLLLSSFPQAAQSGPVSSGAPWAIGAVLSVVAIGVVVAAWLLWRRPGAIALAPGDQMVCNGHAELCERPLDQVTFPAAHNAMSNQTIRDWMFPHHQVGIAAQLQAGVRSLAIDIHYGFPGGSRIRTNLGDSSTQAKMIRAVGEEGFKAAERIRDGLVGVDESKRGMYFCHGFCELGAYEVVPTLAQIRDFMVSHPDEVLLLLIEDYVEPTDLARAFEEAGLLPLVYQDSISTWPALGTLVASGRRILVWIETGKPGVPWLRPFQQDWQETPYTFHTPAEFSCRPNRGGTKAALFLLNHWIETTPAPRPSNAVVVNAYDLLYARARRCEAERSHRVNVVQVDFATIGDLFRVVDSLNLAAKPNTRVASRAQAVP